MIHNKIKILMGATLVGLSWAPTLLADIQVAHLPVKTAPSNYRIALDADVTYADGPVKDVRAYFKAASSKRFYYVPMRASDNGYRGLLPAPELGVGSVDYLIYAVGYPSDKSKGRIFVKTKRNTIVITDDEAASQRMTEKEPVYVEIDIEKIDQIDDFAREQSEPRNNRKVEVRTEAGGTNPSQIPGFSDYIALGPGTPAAAGAGIAAAGTVSTAGGLSTSVLIGSIAAGATGVGLLADSGTSDTSSSGFGGVASDPQQDRNSMVGAWSGGGTTWRINSDNGSEWSGTSTSGGCGDTITIRGVHNNFFSRFISADFSNAQGTGTLSGSISSDGSSVSYNFEYFSGICDGDTGTDTLRRN